MKRALVAGCLAWAALAQAQLFSDPNWQEGPVPAPPDFSLERLLRFEVNPSSPLVYAIDPQTLSISAADRVVRYVVVAYRPGGSTNAIYEGLRCDTAEVKTYARASEPGKWSPVGSPIWRPLDVTQSATRHSLALARQGLCESSAVGGRTPAELVRRLQTPR